MMMSKDILHTIQSPQDIKKLNNKQLDQLASEIRDFLIANVKVTGGHLASNLGTVELTLALHYVFDSPKDQIIFDVGHQSYTHKIITGRLGQFHTLRQYGGLSGFPKPEESPHDIFKVGHSSTSISAALGLARANRIQGVKDANAIAVIGDGAFSGGMVFEALNDADQYGDKIILVLNDNEMSIDANVGAMHSYFSKLRSSPMYYQFKKGFTGFLNKIPGIGRHLARFTERVKDLIKFVFVKGLFFEEMGFTYIGIVNGHDMEKLIEAFKMAKNAPKNVIVHVKTQKGKGYKKAEDRPADYHGLSPMDDETQTNSGIFGDELIKIARENPKVVAVTAAMMSGTGLRQFAQEFPERFFDVGIAEQHAVTMCGGMARNGLHPVFAVYSTFLQRGFDQIAHDICMQNLPVVFAIDRAGLVGADGETHHGVFDVGILRVLPNIRIYAPRTQAELRAMLQKAFTIQGPVCIRYPRCQLPLGDTVALAELDQFEVIRPLKKTTVLSYGPQMKLALQLAKNHDIGVVSARVIKPLDEACLDEMGKKVEHLIILEGSMAAGGLGSAVLEYYAAHDVKLNVTIKGLPDRFITHGSEQELLREVGLDLDSIQRML